MPFPPPPSSALQIFNALPAATQTTFAAGIPGTNSQSENLAVILFSPDLKIIASMDNTNSQVTSSYTVDVTTGFTFSSTQSLSITEEVGVNAEIVTESTSVTFALSFTEEWSTSTTRSMSFSCPPGQKAFVYQGTLRSRLLVFSAADGSYAWRGDTASALTQVLLTSATPVGAAPTGGFRIQSQVASRR